jgi:hypothetical protein
MSVKGKRIAVTGTALSTAESRRALGPQRRAVPV